MAESNLWELRKFLGTHPEDSGVEETVFYQGVKGIEVSLVPGSWSQNPYRSLFTMATATWGDVWATDRWEQVSPQARFEVVKAVLGRKTLPNAMEAPNFMFEISGLSRSAFDQIARARIGAVFGSMGMRDNHHAGIGFRVPDSIWNDEKRLESFKESCLRAKKEYVDILLTGQSNWQDARAVLPMSMCHRFTANFSYMSLQNFMSKRLQFNEQADTVATAWLMRNKLLKKFPLLATYLRPSSDHAKKCTEHVGDEFAQAFGNLFRCSGRWPCDQSDMSYTFNESCSNRGIIMDQLNIYIPAGDEKLPGSETWETLTPSDKVLFEDYITSRDEYRVNSEYSTVGVQTGRFNYSNMPRSVFQL